MESLTKHDLSEALKPLSEKVNVVARDVKLACRDIKLIHEDLKAHDQRAEEVNEAIKELLDLKKLDGKLEQMRVNIREKLGVEV